ncbi:MAG: hypothetical protein WCG55_00565 [bacterium]
MEPTEKEIIESLYKAMCSATSTVSDAKRTNNSYFKRRVLGFKAEIEFSKFIEGYKDIHFFEGGNFISRKLSGKVSDKNKFIYVTLAKNESEDFKEIYSVISQWDEVENLFYIKIDNNSWSQTGFATRKKLRNGKSKDIEDSILVPKYTFYRFNKNIGSFDMCEIQNFDCILSWFSKPTRKSSLFPLRKKDQFEYFSDYDASVLKNIYANRYFLDVILRQASGRQIIDLDGFLKVNGRYFVVEVKEKDPIRKKGKKVDDINNWQFGWDSRRILWYLYLKVKLNLPVLYNIREISNQEERTFVQWDSIFIDDFLKGTSWSNSRSGGGGGDTVLAPHSFFRRLSDVLNELLR